MIRHDWLDGFSSLRDDLRLLASAAEAKQAKTPLVQTRPFRFHFPPYFLGHFSPVLRRLFAVLSRFPASWRRDGESGRKMA